MNIIWGSSITRRVAFVAVLVTLLSGLAIAQQKVYITEHSKHYHLFRDCISLHNASEKSIKNVPVSEVGRRELCGICAHRGLK